MRQTNKTSALTEAEVQKTDKRVRCYDDRRELYSAHWISRQSRVKPGYEDPQLLAPLWPLHNFCSQVNVKGLLTVTMNEMSVPAFRLSASGYPHLTVKPGFSQITVCFVLNFESSKLPLVSWTAFVFNVCHSRRCSDVNLYKNIKKTKTESACVFHPSHALWLGLIWGQVIYSSFQSTFTYVIHNLNLPFCSKEKKKTNFANAVNK